MAVTRASTREWTPEDLTKRAYVCRAFSRRDTKLSYDPVRIEAFVEELQYLAAAAVSSASDGAVATTSYAASRQSHGRLGRHARLESCRERRDNDHPHRAVSVRA